jgi:hypothetical protein
VDIIRRWCHVAEVAQDVGHYRAIEKGGGNERDTIHPTGDPSGKVIPIAASSRRASPRLPFFLPMIFNIPYLALANVLLLSTSHACTPHLHSTVAHIPPLLLLFCPLPDFSYFHPHLFGGNPLWWCKGLCFSPFSFTSVSFRCPLWGCEAFFSEEA